MPNPETAIHPEYICDMELHAVDRLLDDGLVHVHAPLGLCTEALLYSYLFERSQQERVLVA